MAEESNAIPVVVGSGATDLFADEAVTFELYNGVVRITLSSVGMVNPTPPSPVQHNIIARLVMPATSAQRFAIGLFNYLKAQGLDPASLESEISSVQ